MLTNSFFVEAKLIKGRVICDGEPVQNADITINGDIHTKSGTIGDFSIYLKDEIELVTVKKFGYKEKNWHYYEDDNLIRVNLEKTGQVVFGRIKNKQNITVKNTSLFFPKINKTTKTNNKGLFKLLAPINTNENDLKDVLIDNRKPVDVIIKFQTYHFNMALVVDENQQKQSDTENQDLKPITNLKDINQKTEKESSSNDFMEVDVPTSKIEKIICLSEKGTSISKLDAVFDTKRLRTNTKGEIYFNPPIEFDFFNKKEIKIPNYTITNKSIEEETVYLTLKRVKVEKNLKPLSKEEIQSSIYKDEFDNVYDEIKTQRQFLEEHSIFLRQQILKVGEKFNNITDRDSLSSQDFLRYLEALSKEVQNNYSNYEDAIHKTIMLIDTIENNIEKNPDTLAFILNQQEKSLSQERNIDNNRYVRRYLSAFILSIVALTTILVIIIYGDRKIRVKNKQLEDSNSALQTSKKNLEHQIGLVNIERQKTEKAYKNIQLISKVGQKITSNLERSKVIKNAYKSIQGLIKLNEFEIAIYNNLHNALEVSTYRLHEEELTNYTEKLNETQTIMSWCFKQEKEVVIKNSNEELGNYTDLKNFHINIYSGIYIPLKIKDKILGVLGVKKFEIDAYTQNDVSILRAFSSYLAVAFENSNAYKIIKQNNEQITDSLLYAQKMQNVILPSMEQFKEYFREYFVLYRPKDIVSGDFYWVNKVSTDIDKKAILLAVGDCTGHGVPAAFMSILGIRLINEIVNEQKQTCPNLILEKLNTSIQNILKQYDKNNNDGMDISLCLLEHLDNNETKMTFSSAKSCIYIYNAEKREINRVKGDNKLIGGIRENKHSFTNQILYLKKKDVLYLASDGIIHQNNIERQKFGIQRFTNLLKTNKNLFQLKEEIEANLDSFKKETSQRDDITLVGIKV